MYVVSQTTLPFYCKNAAEDSVLSNRPLVIPSMSVVLNIEAIYGLDVKKTLTPRIKKTLKTRFYEKNKKT